MTKNVLFVGSHPDDIELGCLGAVMHYISNGQNVYCIIASDGEGGNGDSKSFNRKEETLAALTGAGVKVENIHFLQLPDKNLPMHSLTITDAVEKFCKDNSINWVFLQSDHDTHQDHKALHSAALSGSRGIKNVLIYESGSSTTTKFSPNYFIDIGPYMQNKVRLLGYHTSQMGKHYMEIDRVEGLAKYRASQSKNAQYAEAFEIFRMMDGNNNGER